MSPTRSSSIPIVYQYKTARELLKTKFEYATLGDLKRRAHLQLMSGPTRLIKKASLTPCAADGFVRDIRAK